MGISHQHKGIPKKSLQVHLKMERCRLEQIILIQRMLVEVVGIKAYCVFKAFCEYGSPRFQLSKTGLWQIASQETTRGDSLFGSVCDPEELQAVDNEKITILITSYEAAVIPF